MRNLRFGFLLLLLAASNLFAADFGHGVRITVRTSTTVSSDRSEFGDPVDAVLVNDLVVDGKVIAREGSTAHCTVASADRSTRGKGSFPGSISIRLETIEGVDGTYHLSANQYTREGKGRGRAPIPGGTTGGISIGSVGGIETQSPVPVQDPNGISVASGGLEAVIPAESIITFKAAKISKPSPKK